MAGCCNGNKEDLKVKFPPIINYNLLREYINSPKKSTFEYFNQLFWCNYVNNNKNQRRAQFNMEQLAGAYKTGRIIENYNKYILNDKYVYELVDNLRYVCTERKKIKDIDNKELFKDVFFINEFMELLPKIKVIEICE